MAKRKEQCSNSEQCNIENNEIVDPSSTKQCNKKCKFEAIPAEEQYAPEIWTMILEYCIDSIETVMAVARVSKLFYSIMSDSQIWKAKFPTWKFDKNRVLKDVSYIFETDWPHICALKLSEEFVSDLHILMKRFSGIMNTCQFVLDPATHTIEIYGLDIIRINFIRISLPINIPHNVQKFDKIEMTVNMKELERSLRKREDLIMIFKDKYPFLTFKRKNGDFYGFTQQLCSNMGLQEALLCCEDHPEQQMIPLDREFVSEFNKSIHKKTILCKLEQFQDSYSVSYEKETEDVSITFKCIYPRELAKEQAFFLTKYLCRPLYTFSDPELSEGKSSFGIRLGMDGFTAVRNGKNGINCIVMLCDVSEEHNVSDEEEEIDGDHEEIIQHESITDLGDVEFYGNCSQCSETMHYNADIAPCLCAVCDRLFCVNCRKLGKNAEECNEEIYEPFEWICQQCFQNKRF